MHDSFEESEPLGGRRVLITGGCGFIGSWICDLLISIGARVICLDDMSTGHSRNITHLKKNTRFKFLRYDVAKRQRLALKCDLVFHLASHPSPDEYQKHPVETILPNSEGTRNMLELARKNDTPFLFASSSEIYGDAQVVPTPEAYWGNVNPIGPRSCYDEGKRFGEAICMAYNRAYGIDVRIARIFNTYGPRLRADGLYARAISRFIRQALSVSDVTVYGSGEQTRSFCYVTDTVLALMLAATRKEMKAQVVNVGNPQEISILSLAERIIKILGSKSSVTFHGRSEDDPQRRCPDISRSKTLLSWAPRVNLEEGLSKTIEWFKTNGGT
jgi:UDP-glucuronate decarboxylase